MAIYCKSFIPRNKITYSLLWSLDECCWSYFHKCYITLLDTTIFNNSFSAERDYECQISLCRILFAFKHKNNSLLQTTSKYYLKMFWLIYMHVILCTVIPLSNYGNTYLALRLTLLGLRFRILTSNRIWKSTWKNPWIK